MKKIIRIPLVLIILLVAVLVFCINKVNAKTTGTITEITVNVREKASIDSDIVMFVTQDDEVEIIEKTGDWYKIKYNKKEGYVYSDFVKVSSDSNISTNEAEQESLESEEETVTQTITPSLLLKANAGVRITPNVLSDVIYETKKDTSIELLEQINGWSYISIDSIRGWARSEQIIEQTETTSEDDNTSETSENVKETKTAYVKYDNVNLRKKASSDSTVLQKLKLNTEVKIIDETDSVWYKVTVDSQTGYISKTLLSDEKQEETTAKEDEDNTSTSRDGESTTRTEVQETLKQTTTTAETKSTSKTKSQVTSSSSSKADEIVSYAKKYLGYDYTYGGTSPKTGFDCSGFTYYVFKHFGYNLSRSSIGQASNGTEVSKEDLQPGDLVIYKNTSLTKIGHVGIYIGDNKMIHASSPGVGVIITDIDSSAYNYPQRFVMGRRIIK